MSKAFFAKKMTNREQNPIEEWKAGRKVTTILKCCCKPKRISNNLLL